MIHSTASAFDEVPRSKTPYSPADPAAGITLNPDQAVYVIPCGEGYSCLGYENARAHAQQIADALATPSLAFTEADFGQPSGYTKYRQATQAWASSRKSTSTYFDPGTPEAVRRILERYRQSGDTLRVVLGDPDTGRDWHEENDVVGRVGRSTGSMKVPLLIEDAADGGAAILTRCVVRLIDWKTQRELYVHSKYKLPELAIVPREDDKYPWEVTIAGETQACFKDIGKAGAYVGFMRGLSIEPRCFQ